MDIDERLTTLREDLELLRAMQLDSIKRAERDDKKFKALRMAIIHDVHSRRAAAEAARIAAIEASQHQVDRIEQMIEDMMNDIESGDTPDDGKQD